MKNTESLSIEQQFEIAKLKKTIETANADQLRSLFVEFYEIMLKKDNFIKSLLVRQLGFGFGDD
jgi:hypothetical protein